MRRLAVATLSLSLTLGPATTSAAEEEPVPTGAFTSAGELAEARTIHGAALLPDGRVLVAGGAGATEPTSSAEIWDPTTSAFAPAAPMASGHSGPIVALPDGRVLVAGGELPSGDVLAAAEVWDPETKSFVPTGAMNTGRGSHTATLLSDGRVFVFGGWGGQGFLGDAEIWDPATDAFSLAGRLTPPRFGYTATALPDGRVLIVGGETDGGMRAKAKIWDPETNTFGPTGSLATRRAYHSSTLLPDGRVLVIGGGTDLGDGGPLASAEIWDPATASFTPAGTLAMRRLKHTSTLLPDGRVLVVGGLGPADPGHLLPAEVWDPTTMTFSESGPPLEDRGEYHTATLLADGRVLIVGGDGGDRWRASAEVWDPAAGPAPAHVADEGAAPSGAFRRAGDLNEARAFHFASLQPDGSVAVFGGEGVDPRGRTIRPRTEIWHPGTETFTPVEPPIKLPEAILAPLGDGRFLSRWSESAATSMWEAWDPLTGERAVLGESIDGRSDRVAVPLNDARILLIGGRGGGRRGRPSILRAEVLDTATGTASRTGGLPEDRYDFTATLLSDGRVLVVGGTGDDDRARQDAYVWYPETGRFEPTGGLSARRSGHAATLLPHGRVLVTGGTDYNARQVLPPAEVWDPATGAFSPAGTMADRRQHHTATLLPDGRVLVAGSEPRAEVWDPATETFSDAGWLDRAHHTATLLPDGRVLIIGGGRHQKTLASAAVWDPEAAPSSAGRTAPKPKATRRQLRQRISPELRCRAYTESEVANDPFAYGATAALVCESPNHPNVDYLAVFRFPDARSLGEYWQERQSQGPDLERRRRACQDGRKGFGKYAAGEPYFCYVSRSSGRALIRWIEIDPHTYGLIDARDRDLAELWDAWLELGPEWYQHQLCDEPIVGEPGDTGMGGCR